MKCDIKIMGSPKRLENIMQEVYALGLDICKDVFLDDRPNGGDALYTARKTWNLPFAEDITHRCVLQDDVQICEGFYEAIQKLVNLYPDAVISLYSSRRDVMKCKNIVVEIVRGGSTAQALICPIGFAEKAFKWALSICDFYPHDDAAICEYARTHGVKILLTRVSLVQHLTPTKSLLKFNSAGKVAKNFIQSAEGIDWSTKGDIPKMITEACCPSSVEMNTPNYIEWWLKNDVEKVKIWRDRKRK